MRIALCQIPVSSEISVNLTRVRDALKEAAAGGAELAVLPEATMVRFGSNLAAAAEPLDGPFCSAVAEASAAAGVASVTGVFEPAPDGRVYNTAVAYDAAGALVAAYRKLHLFDALGQRESDLVAPGSAPVIADLAGAPVGVQICYDIRFPELTRALAIGGARLVTVSAAWQAGLFKEEHWVTLLRARAIENTVWIAAAGQVPDPDAKPVRAPTGVGRSMLVDPLGVVRCDLGPSAGVAVVEADLTVVDPVRETLPSLANRRDDIFNPKIFLSRTKESRLSSARLQSRGFRADQPPAPLVAPVMITTTMPATTAATIGRTSSISQFVEPITASSESQARRAADGRGSAARAARSRSRRMVSASRS
ncbi:MAG: carbon-nitrogen hydrolase family protein [Nocardiopsaceae bacterium]|nr:carbon-nitrogen hydrolase family protein [Nocardiopsaceae bacterium]